MPPTNNAAFLLAKHTPLAIRPAPYTPPGSNELVVKNSAIAINPYDWIIQEAANLVVSWAKIPIILGTDVAGSVVEIGSGISRFKPGDRVVGIAVGLDKRVNTNVEGGFQEYTILRQELASPIPEWLSYEKACVLPLGLSTAACGLFMKDYLGLQFPTTPPTRSGQTLLVWGGSTSVGCNAIQLATAAGYDVITTASPKNHELLKRLGAVHVFDYRSATVVQDIISVLKKEDRTAAGAMSIGSNSLKPCMDVLSQCKGNKFIAQASMNLPTFPKSALQFPGFVASMMGTLISNNVRLRMKGVNAKMINGSDLVANEIGKAMYEDFLPKALKEGRFVAAPEPEVVGHGLEHLQNAMDLNKKGVSAKKLVVTL